MVLLEAMAAGVPCVATAVGGIAGLLGRARGLLVPAQDSAALASAMTSVAQVPELRARLVVNAKENLRNNHALDATVDRYLEPLGLSPSIAEFAPPSTQPLIYPAGNARQPGTKQHTQGGVMQEIAAAADDTEIDLSGRQPDHVHADLVKAPPGGSTQTTLGPPQGSQRQQEQEDQDRSHPTPLLDIPPVAKQPDGVSEQAEVPGHRDANARPL